LLIYNEIRYENASKQSGGKIGSKVFRETPKTVAISCVKPYIRAPSPYLSALFDEKPPFVGKLSEYFRLHRFFFKKSCKRIASEKIVSYKYLTSLGEQFFSQTLKNPHIEGAIQEKDNNVPKAFFKKSCRQGISTL
jgi:hypothetical protein